MSTLIITKPAEANNVSNIVDDISKILSEAQKLGNVEVAIINSNNNQTASHELIDELSHFATIKKINHLELQDDKLTAENISHLILNHISKNSYNYILMAADTFSKNILPRIAAMLDVNQISDCIKIEDKETFHRPIYAGNAILKIKSNDAVKVITLRTSCFAEVAKSAKQKLDIAKIDVSTLPEYSAKYIKTETPKSERPDLSKAKIVVSGGRGLGSKENFDNLITPLADKLNAAIGATRAVVDAGFAPNNLQVGQTGKSVSPELYIAVGISGAIQHISGMKDSKTILAIDKNPDAPIFKIADIGLVGDLFQIVPELTEKL